MAKVSIIIATHSRPNLLPRAVASAFAAGSEVEVVVVDDASTDATAEVCKTLDGIKYIRAERNQGTAGARNLGILASTSQYIGFLDDDDWRLPGSLDKQVAILDENPECGLVYGQYLQADHAGEITNDPPEPDLCEQGDLFWKLLESNRFGCLTVVFRKDCVHKVGMLDPNYSGADDWDLWVRIGEQYPITAICEPVAVWRTAVLGSDQGSVNESKLLMIGARAYREKWLDLLRAKEELGDRLESKRRSLLNGVSERILFDMAHRTKGRRQKIKKMIAAIQCNPAKIYSMSFYKTAAKNLMFP